MQLYEQLDRERGRVEEVKEETKNEVGGYRVET